MVEPSSSDATFNTFYSEVKQIEKQDSVLTSAQQIERLLRPGATYRNLNPFEVLQVEFDIAPAELKKKYKRLSILVHPDKNQDDKDRAQSAFDIVNKAYKTLNEETTRQLCMDVVEEAQHVVNTKIQEKRKKLKKEGNATEVEEDDPAVFKRAIQVQTMKLFADNERKRRDLEIRDQEERKRKREQEIHEEENKKIQKEWNKNFEESRQGRVNSWHDFQSGGSSGKKKSKKKPLGFRPPKLKPEQR